MLPKIKFSHLHSQKVFRENLTNKRCSYAFHNRNKSRKRFELTWYFKDFLLLPEQGAQDCPAEKSYIQINAMSAILYCGLLNCYTGYFTFAVVHTLIFFKRFRFQLYTLAPVNCSLI